MNVERIFNSVKEEAGLHWDDPVTLARIYWGAIFGFYALAKEGIITEDQAGEIDERFMDDVFKEIARYKERESAPTE